MATECFPVWEFIAEEMAERGWTRSDLAVAMGGDIELNLCTLDFTEALATSHPDVYLGQETADGLARAFGTSAEMWLNLDESYRECRAKRAAVESN